MAVADQAEAVRLASNVDSKDALYVGEQLTGTNTEISAEVTDIRFKNTVSVWNRETGTHSYATPNLIPDMTRQRIPRGKYAGQAQWAMRREDIPAEVLNRPVPPKMPCYLNETHPDAERYYGMGYAACEAKNIPSIAALKLHMAKSHKNAWKTILEENADADRKEDRDAARATKEAMETLVATLIANQPVPAAVLESPVGQAAVAEVASVAPAAPVTSIGQTAILSEAPAAPPSEETLAALEEVEKSFTATCQTCGEDSQGKSQAGAEASLRGHIAREHPPE